MSAFQGFSRKAPAFFAELAKNNSRDWFKANEASFKAQVLAPMHALVDALPASRQPFRFFRMHRDIRFSADKSPYKLWQGALHHRPGGAIEYFHVDAQGLLAVAGMHQMTPAQIGRLRDAIADAKSGALLEGILAALGRSGTKIEPGLAEPLKRVPRGYDPQHRRAEMLKWKGLMATRRVGVAKIGPKAELVRALVAFWDETEALNGWLDRHVGPG